jgi:YgiT-type zinc finger domain-containing protein
VKKIKLVNKEVKELEDIICNKCGSSLRIDENYHGCPEVLAEFNYGSKYDGLRLYFSLCENCVIDLFKDFKFSPEKIRNDGDFISYDFEEYNDVHRCPECGGIMEYRLNCEDVIEYNGYKIITEIEGWWCRDCGEGILTGEHLINREKVFENFKSEMNANFVENYYCEKCRTFNMDRLTGRCRSCWHINCKLPNRKFDELRKPRSKRLEERGKELFNNFWNIIDKLLKGK